MSVIVECSAPAGSFEVGRVLQEVEYTRAELEGMVAVGSGATTNREPISPFLWVADANTAALATRLRHAEGIRSEQLLDEFDDRALFNIEWEPKDGGFIRELLALDVTIMDAVGTADRWRFRLRFHTDEALSAFRINRQERAFSIGVQRVVDLADWETEQPADAMGLTSAQHDALLAGLKGGLFRRAPTNEPSRSQRRVGNFESGALRAVATGRDETPRRDAGCTVSSRVRVVLLVQDLHKSPLATIL